MFAFQAQRITKPCEHCHAPMVLLPSTQHQRFCSVLCFRSWEKAQPRKDRIVLCLHCHAPIQEWPSKQRTFCSPACYHAGKRTPKRLTQQCEGCGEPFTSYARTQRRFCSIACRFIAKARDDTHLPKPCLGCGHDFRKGSPSKTAKAQFCSQQCYAHYRSQLRGRIEKPCARCGTIMILMPCHADRQFCSQRCNTTTIASKRIVNPPRLADRHRLAWHARRAFPLACMICGWTDHVEACHIIAVSQQGPNELDNIVMLCPNHHKMFDGGRLTVRQVRAAKKRALAALETQQASVSQVIEQTQLF